VCAGINYTDADRSWDSLSHWGALPAGRIWDGHYWALITSAFVHVALWHLVANVYWLYRLGGAMERVVGPACWLGFVLVAGLASSGAQLAVSGNPGIGFSGIGYAFFGFVWIQRREHAEFSQALDARTVRLFLFWAAACIVATQAGWSNIGNVAHVIGLVFGVGCSAATRWFRCRRPIMSAVTTLVIVSLLPLFWAPWLPGWAIRQAVEAHRHGDYGKAIGWYEQGMRRGASKSWCLENLALARASLGETVEVERLRSEIKQIDSAAAQDLDRRLAESK
jgi:GlpG protein